MYAFSWMDSGVVYHFATGGRLLVLLTFLGSVVVAAIARKVGWVLWFAMLGSAAFTGFPLEMTGGLMMFTYAAWVLGLAMADRKRAMVPAVGLLGLVVACLLGFPRTFVAGGAGCRSNLRNLAVASEMYASDHQAAPKTLDALVSGNYYLRKLPGCRPDQPSGYRIESEGRRFTVYCDGAWHAPKDQPTPVAGPEATATPRR